MESVQGHNSSSGDSSGSDDDMFEILLQTCSQGDFEGFLSVIHNSESFSNALMTIRDHRGNSCLHLAAESGCFEIVDYFLSNHPAFDIDLSNNDGVTALMKACERGAFEVVELLVENGAQVDCQSVTSPLSTALMKAAHHGHHDVVDYLIKQGKADANYKDRETGFTALMLAAKRGCVETVRVLLVNGAKSCTQANDGSTAVELANGEFIRDLIRLQIDTPTRPIRNIVIGTFVIGLLLGYLLSFLPTPLRGHWPNYY